MENLDIVILSSIVATLFVVFFIVVYREFSSVDENTYKTKKDGGPRVQLVKFMGSLFDEGSIKVEDKKMIYKAMNRTIADMESDGIYFSDDVKDELKRQREELKCEYSGLPSVKAYEN
jgi:hypothetical protein